MEEGGSWHAASAIQSPGADSNLTLLQLRALHFAHSSCLLSVGIPSAQRGDVSLLLSTSGLLSRAILTVLRRDSGAKKLINQQVAVVPMLKPEQWPKLTKSILR